MRVFRDSNIEALLKVSFSKLPAQVHPWYLARNSAEKLSSGARCVTRTCFPSLVYTIWRTGCVWSPRGWKTETSQNF
jgi:hypothetical protein